jgi:hypothetical protein
VGKLDGLLEAEEGADEPCDGLEGEARLAVEEVFASDARALERVLWLECPASSADTCVLLADTKERIDALPLSPSFCFASEAVPLLFSALPCDFMALSRASAASAALAALSLRDKTGDGGLSGTAMGEIGTDDDADMVSLDDEPGWYALAREDTDGPVLAAALDLETALGGFTDELEPPRTYPRVESRAAGLVPAFDASTLDERLSADDVEVVAKSATFSPVESCLPTPQVTGFSNFHRRPSVEGAFEEL